MKFEIRRYRSARWDAEIESHVLGEPSETVREIEAAYPALAQEAAEETVVATRTETTQCMQFVKGKKRLVTFTTYLTTSDAMCAWQTADGVLALVAV